MAGVPPPNNEQSASGQTSYVAPSGTGKDDATKVFNDCVHGHFEFHPLLVKIINTPEFQRLRFIKQLGMCYFVYPGASHNRFEHSLGVCYLAGELVRSLEKKQPDLLINDRDILCVEIAGLCHDLGHGPFSHLFDNLFIPKVRLGHKQKHEELSVAMFGHMYKKRNLEEQFTKYGLDVTPPDRVDLIFIEELIFGAKEYKGTWPYKGRGKEYSFLYEIVANKRNGIDVDKWDYFARDSLYLGINSSFDWRRFVKFARVIEAKDGKQICIREKELSNLYEMFHTRYMLHKRAYQHKVTKILEAMIVEALIEANDYLSFPGEYEADDSDKDRKAEAPTVACDSGRKRKMYKMSEAIDDMEAYSKMTDHAVWAIPSSTDEKLNKSKEILERVMERDLYPFVGETKLQKFNITPPHVSLITEEDARKQIYCLLDSKATGEVKEADIIVHIVRFDYGKAEEDPIDHVKFYEKSNPGVAIEASEILDRDPMALPQEFSVEFMRVYVKCRKVEEQVVDSVRKAFDKWCVDKGLRKKPTTGGSSAGPPGRPEKRSPPPQKPSPESSAKKRRLFPKQEQPAEHT